MCIICVKPKGVNPPDKEVIAKMFKRNHDGAGYMFYNNIDKCVEIHKGFMSLSDYLSAIEEEKFTKNDVIIYHFRIATQGGVNLEMTHPFPLTKNYNKLGTLDLLCGCGIAHNGIIALTTHRNKESKYSDTAEFIAEYLSDIIRNTRDFDSDLTKAVITDLVGTGNKLALLDKRGKIKLIGRFIEENGLLYSNYGFMY